MSYITTRKKATIIIGIYSYYLTDVRHVLTKTCNLFLSNDTKIVIYIYINYVGFFTQRLIILALYL